MDPLNTVLLALVKNDKASNKRLINLETAVQLQLSFKETTGVPATPFEGMFVINSFDNNIRVYADGGWRTLASW